MREAPPPSNPVPRRRLLVTGGTAAAVALVAAALIAIFGRPPRSVTLATGPPGSAYAAISERYKALLARSGVTLHLVSTAGDGENLAKLLDPRSGVSAAFVMSGLPEAREARGIESLGTVAYEPLWLFERASAPGVQLEGLAHRRVSVGLPGSGTAELVHRLFEETGLSAEQATILRLPPDEGAERLVRGELDVLAVLTDWDSPIVRRLAGDPRVSIVSYRRAGALVALNPDLYELRLPAGTGDFARGLPPDDVTLVAPKASLLVREEVPDSIQFLLLDAASKVHAQPGIFHRAGTFPAAEAIEFPLSDEAARYHKSGRPFFQRHLPFWAAVLVERLLLVLVPLLGVLFPAVNGIGNAYRGMMQQRILALYGELRLVEQALEEAAAKGDHVEVAERLDDLERRASRLRVPVQVAQMLYTLKDHVRAVRNRLAA